LKNLNTLAAAKNFLFLGEWEKYARQQVNQPTAFFQGPNVP